MVPYLSIYHDRKCFFIYHFIKPIKPINYLFYLRLSMRLKAAWLELASPVDENGDNLSID